MKWNRVVAALCSAVMLGVSVDSVLTTAEYVERAASGNVQLTIEDTEIKLSELVDNDCNIPVTLRLNGAPVSFFHLAVEMEDADNYFCIRKDYSVENDFFSVADTHNSFGVAYASPKAYSEIQLEVSVYVEDLNALCASNHYSTDDEIVFYLNYMDDGIYKPYETIDGPYSMFGYHDYEEYTTEYGELGKRTVNYLYFNDGESECANFTWTNGKITIIDDRENITYQVTDLVELNRYIHGDYWSDISFLADLNADGEVDVFDLSLLKRKLLSQ